MRAARSSCSTRATASTPDTVCPECRQSGTLQAGTLTEYIGKPAHTARFLAKIERSGRHLLQMVNGVLDFSKMEAGRLELALEPIDLAELLRETTDEMIDVARSALASPSRCTSPTTRSRGSATRCGCSRCC